MALFLQFFQICSDAQSRMLIITESVVKIHLLVDKSFMRVVWCFAGEIVNLHGGYTVGLMSGLSLPKLCPIVGNLRIDGMHGHLIFTFLSEALILVLLVISFQIIWCFSPLYHCWSSQLAVRETFEIFSRSPCLEVFSFFLCGIS